MKIAGVKTPKVPFAVEAAATERAMVFASGWVKKDREAFDAAMAEMRAVAEHNQTVYAQASEALNDLSRREKVCRESEARVAEATAALERSRHEQARAAEQENARLSAAARDLADERASCDAGRKAATDALDAREKALQQRETAAARMEADQAEKARVLDARETTVRALAKETDDMRAKLRAIVGA